MTEIEKMKRAKMYIDKLANGISPIDDSVVPAYDVVNNVNISRCFFYISDILRQVIENGGTGKAVKRKKEPFNISYDEIKNIQYSDTPIPVSQIAERINSLVDTETMKKISHKHISDWLISVGILEIQSTADGKSSKRPTTEGHGIGIATEQRTGMRGIYTVTVYNRAAQEFVVDHIDAIIEMINRPKLNEKL